MPVALPYDVRLRILRVTDGRTNEQFGINMVGCTVVSCCCELLRFVRVHGSLYKFIDYSAAAKSCRLDEQYIIPSRVAAILPNQAGVISMHVDQCYSYDVVLLAWLAALSVCSSAPSLVMSHAARPKKGTYLYLAGAASIIHTCQIL